MYITKVDKEPRFKTTKRGIEKKMIRIFKGLKANYFNLFAQNNGCFKRLYKAISDVLFFVFVLVLLITLTPILFIIYFFRVMRKKTT